ncbi:UNVERIFIED_CONTAM: hypothetical protein Slati_1479100 [Sesamum latifolium]|uniref:Secreted protein n=1 Tax=Sesamum latifolium TaxID=2727402 RepID=A0AAW2X5D4_9LAMI
MEKRLNSVFQCFLLLANWCRKRERNSRKLPITAGGNWLNHYCAAREKVVTKTRHLMPSVYQCSRAAFSNRDRCSCGSVVPSYSAMAGVRQFTGNSSAMTSSVKGMPGCSSAGAPITWCWTSCSPFWRDSSRANHWGGTFPAWAGGCWAGSRTASGLGITKVGSACLGTTTLVALSTGQARGLSIARRWLM